MRKTKKLTAKAAAQQLFRKHGGVLRTAQAIDAGVHPRVLYALRDDGIVQPIARGLFRLTDMAPLESPDLFVVASKVPRGVICLISALAFHGLTTQSPREVSIALAKGSEEPRIGYPPVKFYWISGPAFLEGIENHKKDGTVIRVYCAEKTLADCFKFRNKIGLDVCIEALREWRARKRPDIGKLMHFAKICRVEKIIRPYLDAIL